MQRPTIGIDFISQNIFLEDKTIRLQLWDTAGQERFKALIPNYIRDTSVAIIVYDVTNRQSFKSVQKWIDDVKAQRGEGVIIALLANKVDLQERDIQESEGMALAERNTVGFKEVSAKTGANIQEFFKEVAAQLPEVNEPTARSKPVVEVPTTSLTKNESSKPGEGENMVLGKSKGQEGRDKRGCC
jgi:Ras-related protein Rab-6A